MTKISFFLVFSIVLAMPFRSVMGQDWNDLVGQAGLTQTLDEAKKAIGAANGIAGAATGQEALNDYFGGSEDVAEAGASLADLLDTEGNTTTDAGTPPADSPVGAPEDLPADSDDLDDEDDDDDDFLLSPAGAPQQAPTSAPSESPASHEAPEYAPTKAPSRAPSKPPANAPTKTPKLAPKNAPAEAPKDDDEDERIGAPKSAPTKAPVRAPERKAPVSDDEPAFELDPADPDYVAPPKGAPGNDNDDDA